MSALNTEFVKIELIEDDGTRLRRAVNEDTVTRLIQSLKEIGLKTPIVVRYFEHRVSTQNGTDDSFVLVVGGHRVEAARRLGWEKIEAHVLDDRSDDRELRLWEIAENLDRSELTQLERKEHIAEWVRITSSPKGAQVAPPVAGGQQPKDKGIKAAVRELGVERTEAQRSLQVAGMAPEAKQAARDLHLDDNQTALLKAARETTAQQQVARLHELARANEKAKQDREVNKTIALTSAEEYADWLMRKIDLHEMPKIVDWLEGTKPKDVIAALRRLTKDPAPIMDRAGWAA